MSRAKAPSDRERLEMYSFFVLELVLMGKLNIRELPFEIRRQNASAYVSQFRYSRSVEDWDEYDQALALLKQDLERMTEDDIFYRRFQDIYEIRLEERQRAGTQKDYQADVDPTVRPNNKA